MKGKRDGKSPRETKIKNLVFRRIYYMKKYLIFALCLALGLICASAAMAYTGTFIPGNGINGTVHDLGTSHDGMNYTALPADTVGGRICIFCHAPHNTIRLSTANLGLASGSASAAPDAFTYLPLWNHTLTNNYASYSMYWNGPGAPTGATNPHASQAIQQGMQPGSTSLLCLSCHDGSVAVNAYGNASQPAGSVSSGGGTIGLQYTIGLNNNLQNHHPIGFDYNAAQAIDTELRPSTTVMTNSGTTIADHLYAGNNMECGTCHSVHNKANTGERLLWRSDINSQLCLTCHDKGAYTAPADGTGVALP
jgi:predicted CXXCH cytochrome family protein